MVNEPVGPLQAAGVMPEKAMVICDGLLTPTEAVFVVQKLASVTVTIYEPAPTVNTKPDCGVPPFRLYIYGGVPPLAMTNNEVVLLLQLTVPAFAMAASWFGWVKVNVTLVVHPLLSVTTTM